MLVTGKNCVVMTTKKSGRHGDPDRYQRNRSEQVDSQNMRCLCTADPAGFRGVACHVVDGRDGRTGGPDV